MVQFQPILDEKEWSLVLQLLETERQELPVELRHTDSREYFNALDERRLLIENLIQRLHAQGVHNQA